MGQEVSQSVGGQDSCGLPKVSLEASWVSRAAAAKAHRQGCQPLITRSSCLDK
jgi:hypothetical protein